MCCVSKKDKATTKIDLVKRQVTFPGVIRPEHYNTYSDRANGHHFIVWSGGNNSKKALIVTQIPDDHILSALEALKVKPGNNLTVETWNERANPSSPAPEKHVKGTKIKISVSWDDKELPAHELFENSDEDDFEFRVGGHRDLISVWHSGCVTCLFSCPGGRTSNAVYTIRDQYKDRKTFKADLSRLPEDGTPVKVHMKVVQDETLEKGGASSEEDSG